MLAFAVGDVANDNPRDFRNGALAAEDGEVGHRAESAVALLRHQSGATLQHVCAPGIFEARDVPPSKIVISSPLVVGESDRLDDYTLCLDILKN